MLDDILTSIFRNAYPDSSDEDIKNQVSGLKSAGSDAVSKALSFIPGASMVKDIAGNAGPLAKEAANSSTVKDIASGLSGGPISSLVPNPGNPVADVAQGALVGGLTDLMRPSPDKLVPNQTDEGPGPTPEDTKMPPAIPLPPMPSGDGSAKPSGKAAPSLEQAITSSPPNDNALRQAELANEKKKHALGTIPVALAGVGDAISAAAKPFGGESTTGSAAKIGAELEKGEDKRKAQTETDIQNDPNSDVSKAYRQMVLTIAPELSKQPNFMRMSAKDIGDKLPLIDTMMKAKATEASKQMASGLKSDQQQDRLEQNVRQSFMSMRGDQSLQRIESQRDAAIQAYNTIESIKKENRMPSQIEYYDILGQLWKARTGASPTDQAIKDLDAKTFKGNFGKVAQYFTGKPAGITTHDILNNVQEFTKTSGLQADKQHEAYMASRMVKPKDLADERWEPLAKAGRGMSFGDATKASQVAGNRPGLSSFYK